MTVQCSTVLFFSLRRLNKNKKQVDKFEKEDAIVPIEDSVFSECGS